MIEHKITWRSFDDENDSNCQWDFQRSSSLNTLGRSGTNGLASREKILPARHWSNSSTKPKAIKNDVRPSGYFFADQHRCNFCDPLSA